MSRTPKRVAIGMALPILLALIAWSSTFLYWHVRIGRALRSLEARTGGRSMATRDYRDEFKTLESAGCRSPRVLDAMEDPARYELHHDLFRILVSAQHPPASDVEDDEDASLAMILIWETRATPNDTAPERLAEYRRLREWWEMWGRRYHRGWRVWSSTCLADRTGLKLFPGRTVR